MFSSLNTQGNLTGANRLNQFENKIPCNLKGCMSSKIAANAADEDGDNDDDDVKLI